MQGSVIHDSPRVFLVVVDDSGKCVRRCVIRIAAPENLWVCRLIMGNTIG